MSSVGLVQPEPDRADGAGVVADLAHDGVVLDHLAHRHGRGRARRGNSGRGPPRHRRGALDRPRLRVVRLAVPLLEVVLMGGRRSDGLKNNSIGVRYSIVSID